VVLSLFHGRRSEDSDRCCDLPVAIELKVSSLDQREKKETRSQWRHLPGFYSPAVHYENRVTA